MAAKPPPQLLAAIQKAVKGTPVSVATMVGIWRIESASTYPNPAVNSIGYGGLFGTKDWNGSTQAQADLAVSILARLIRTNQNSLPKALLAYSGGGYSSVDGSGGTTTANTGGSGSTAPQPTPAPTPTPAPAAQFIPPANTSTSPLEPPNLQAQPGPDVELPGSQSYTIGQPHLVQSLWSQVNQGSFVSPDAALMLQNASGG